jgi:hypothetical protein
VKKKKKKKKKEKEKKKEKKNSKKEKKCNCIFGGFTQHPVPSPSFLSLHFFVMLCYTHL